MARVTFSDTMTKEQAVLKLGRQGVLTTEEIEQRASPEGEVGSFTFDTSWYSGTGFRTVS